MPAPHSGQILLDHVQSNAGHITSHDRCNSKPASSHGTGGNIKIAQKNHNLKCLSLSRSYVQEDQVRHHRSFKKYSNIEVKATSAISAAPSCQECAVVAPVSITSRVEAVAAVVVVAVVVAVLLVARGAVVVKLPLQEAGAEGGVVVVRATTLPAS